VDDAQDARPRQFGAVLREHRLRAALSLEELAERSGMSVRAIANMESGRTTRPHGRSVRSLALGLQLDQPTRDELLWTYQVTRTAPSAARPAQPASSPARAKRRRPGRPGVPRQLPGATRHFVGRSAELGELTKLLDGTSPRDPSVVATIAGIAGIGKTALAVCWAHRVADRFPDGQLYVDLRGFDPDGRAVTPADALRRLLEDVGVPAEAVPGDLAARSALYRSLLAGRRMLVILDNARDAQHVRTLLPGHGANFAVVTSRQRLIGLVAGHGARPLELGLLTQAQSYELLSRFAGRERVDGERAQAAALLRACSGLPLAVAIAGARTAAMPAVPLAEIWADLTESRRPLDALCTGDPASDVRSVLAWSYRQLSEAAARMFWLLGAHWGPDISAPAAASLAALSVPDARRALRELTSAQLLTRQPDDRHRFHDLLRAYAEELAGRADHADERREALHRAYSHYAQTAGGASRTINPYKVMIAAVPERPGASPVAIEGRDAADAWFGAELQVLRRAVLSSDPGYDQYRWQLAHSMWDYLERNGRRQDELEIEAAGYAAAQRDGDLAAQALTQRFLGRAQARAGNHEAAITNLAEAASRYQVLADVELGAHCRADLAWVYELQGRYRLALTTAEQALALYDQAGNSACQAAMLNSLGWIHAQLEDFDEAVVYCQRSIQLADGLGNLASRANAWDSLGYVRHRQERYAEATRCYEEADRILRGLGIRNNRGFVLDHLGDSWCALGDVAAARECWQDALVILAEIRHPSAGAVQVKLAEASQPI
jgi:tetratricopeptide (TPR) repeat protein/transcriptional regulator with XRE-family HTH domain